MNTIKINFDKDITEDGYEYAFYAMRDKKCYWLATACTSLSKRIQSEIVTNAKATFGESVAIDWTDCLHLIHD